LLLLVTPSSDNEKCPEERTFATMNLTGIHIKKYDISGCKRQENLNIRKEYG